RRHLVQRRHRRAHRSTADFEALRHGFQQALAQHGLGGLVADEGDDARSVRPLRVGAMGFGRGRGCEVDTVGWHQLPLPAAGGAACCVAAPLLTVTSATALSGSGRTRSWRKRSSAAAAMPPSAGPAGVAVARSEGTATMARRLAALAPFG